MTPVDPYLYRLRQSLKFESLKREWAIAAARRNEEELKEDRQRKREEDYAEALIAALATPEQIAAFEVKLTGYDEATVKALMENERFLDLTNKKIEAMMGEAHLLPDGRRVFKTRDGSLVVDEHGVELSAEQIDARDIDNKKPRWENVKAQFDMRDILTEERKQLLEYQEKLDDARTRLDDDTLTAKELDDLDKELKDTMPPAVKKQADLDTPDTGPQTFDPAIMEASSMRRKQNGLWHNTL